MQWLPKKEARNHASLYLAPYPSPIPFRVNAVANRWNTASARIRCVSQNNYNKVARIHTHNTHTHICEGAHTRKCILYDQHLN